MALVVYREGAKNTSTTTPDIITQRDAPYDSNTEAWKAHDGDTATHMMCRAVSLPQWWKIELENPLEMLEVTMYSYYAEYDNGHYAPKRWTVYGSTDDVTYDLLADKDPVAWVNKVSSVILSSTKVYKYYKIELYGDANVYMYIHEFDFWYEQKNWYFKDVSEDLTWDDNHFNDTSSDPRMETFQDITPDYAFIETTEFFDTSTDEMLYPTIFRDQSIDDILIVQIFQERSPDHKGIITYFVDRSINYTAFNISRFYDISNDIPSVTDSPQTYSGVVIRRIP